MRSNEDNTIKNYTSKEDIIFNRVLLPATAPAEYENPEKLWNEVERVEKSVNAQLYRSFVVALPKELTDKQNIQLANDFAQSLINEGMCVDLAIHRGSNDNIHMHITTPLRGLDENGKFLPKRKDSYVLDKDGNRIPVLDKNGNQKKKKNGQLVWKTESKFLNDWHTKEKLQEWRKSWEVICNRHLKENGINHQIDCRSNKARNLEEKPTIHEGYKARGIVARGGRSDRVDYNTAIKEYNSELQNLKKIESAETLESVKLHYLTNKENDIKAECEALEKEIIEAEKQLAEARALADPQAVYNLIDEYESILKNENVYKTQLEKNQFIGFNTNYIDDAKAILASEKNPHNVKFWELSDKKTRLNVERNKLEPRVQFERPSIFHPIARAEWDENYNKLQMCKKRLQEITAEAENEYKLFMDDARELNKKIYAQEYTKFKNHLIRELAKWQDKRKSIESKNPVLIKSDFITKWKNRREAENEKKRQEEQRIKEAEREKQRKRTQAQAKAVKAWAEKNGVHDNPEGGSR